MSEINPFYTIVEKPIVWAMTHIFGHHVEDQVTADVQALEPKIQSALASLLGVKVAAIITSTDITLAAVNTAIIPETDALIAQAIASSGAPSEYVSKLTTWAEAILPDLIKEIYDGVTGTPAAPSVAPALSPAVAAPEAVSTATQVQDEPKADDGPTAAMQLVASSDADMPG